jgi:hypothetical protein
MDDDARRENECCRISIDDEDYYWVSTAFLAWVIKSILTPLCERQLAPDPNPLRSSRYLIVSMGPY